MLQETQRRLEGLECGLRLWCVTPSTALWSLNSYAMNLISAQPLFLSLPGAIRPAIALAALHVQRTAPEAYCWYCRRIIM